jgi:polysaccharide biosynthesis transport protein
MPDRVGGRTLEEQEGDISQTLQTAVGIVVRRRRWILGVTALVTLAVIAASFRLPNRYVSEATVLLVQQQVPERYVTPTSTTEISQALDAIKQDVLSRGRLLGIIKDLNLYPKERSRLSPEQLAVRMREDVQIEPLLSNAQRRDVNAFSISFEADTPQLAQEVANRITNSFIEQNLKSRSDQASTTTRFLHEQLEAAKQRLAEQEQRLKDYKLQNLGELPEQQQGNLSILAGLQGQLQNVMAGLNRAQQQRSYLESLISEYRRLGTRKMPSASGVLPDNQPATLLELAQADLDRLKVSRQRLLTQYTAQHPEVLKKDREIANQQLLVDNLAAQQTPRDKAPKTAQNVDADSTANAETNAMLAQLKSQLEANRLEIDNLNKSEQQLKTQIEQYQGRLNLTPVREQQLSSMLRDYEISKQNYADLLSKENQSQLSASLEKRQEGQQLRLADPPNLPTAPSKPKRIKLAVWGFGLGLALGVALAVFIEFRKPCFYTEKQVSAELGIPMVVAIPETLTASEKRIRTWGTVLEWCSSTGIVLVIAAAEYYVYRHG